jgi:hypothetical protein
MLRFLLEGSKQRKTDKKTVTLNVTILCTSSGMLPSCTLVEMDRHFGGTCRFRHQCHSNKHRWFLPETRGNIPNDLCLHTRAPMYRTCLLATFARGWITYTESRPTTLHCLHVTMLSALRSAFIFQSNFDVCGDRLKYSVCCENSECQQMCSKTSV